MIPLVSHGAQNLPILSVSYGEIYYEEAQPIVQG